MEATARLRYVQGSAQKMRLVADLIRGKQVQDAVNLLGVTHKLAARHVEKCLKSAIANAENREEHVDVDRLYVKEIFVDGGPMAKRIRPAPMGRAFRVLKRQSHLTIKLDTWKAGDPPLNRASAAKSAKTPRSPKTVKSAKSAPAAKAPKSAKA
jgi:large subunit ribosomal protein L22